MALMEDRRRISLRLTVLQYGITVMFSVLAVSFWVLQVVQHAKYAEIAENNHQRTLALRAPRGLVFDRDGRVLVENRNSYSISIVREHTKDINRTIRQLATVLGIEEAQVREIVERHRREPSYRPITVVQDASLAQVAAVTARRLDFELPDSSSSGAAAYRGDGRASVRIAARQDPMSRKRPLKSGDFVGPAGIERSTTRC
jgi:penicillin-binding protein 2